MASLAQAFNEHDALIFEKIGDTLTFGSDSLKGIFYSRYRQIELDDGSVIALDVSFDCQVTGHEWVLNLVEDDEVVVAGTTYRFGRRLPERGDESGLVTLALKEAVGA